MSKRAPLRPRTKSAALSEPESGADSAVATPLPTPTATSRARAKTQPGASYARQAGVRHVGVYLSPECHVELKRLALDLEQETGKPITVMDIMRAGIDLILLKQGRPALAGTIPELSDSVPDEDTGHG